MPNKLAFQIIGALVSDITIGSTIQKEDIPQLSSEAVVETFLQFFKKNDATLFLLTVDGKVSTLSRKDGNTGIVRKITTSNTSESSNN